MIRRQKEGRREMSVATAPPQVAPRVTRRVDWKKRLKRASVALLVLTTAVALFWPYRGIHRLRNETIKVPLASPFGSPYMTEKVVPNLKFFEPTGVVALPDDSGRLWVLERRGSVQMVEDDYDAVEKTTVVDFSEQVIRTPYDDDGALGIALHPEFGQADSPNRGYFYIFYTALIDDVCYDRLSRFTIADGEQVADRDSELVLIDQRDRDLWHNGGALAFGPDGFLYVGVGDEGSLGDDYRNGQRINRNLFSGLLRIDVDQRGGEVSHPIRRQPQNGRTAHYYIPSDNPFVGVEGALEEFYSIGLRNPHRISFDRQGRLWVGDVGQDLREELNLARPGTNHQWSYAEGTLPFDQSHLRGKKPDPYFGIESPPAFSYGHLNMNNAVIAGHTYYGEEYPELEGAFIYGDNGSGRIWALRFDENGKAHQQELLAINATGKTGLASFGLDADGEILIVEVGEGDQEGGTIYRLVESDGVTGNTMPEKLSETGIFADLANFEPEPGVIPYEINVSRWHDGAIARRWIMLPGDGTDPESTNDRIGFAKQDKWRFPPGTIFVKHLDLPMGDAAGDGRPVRPVETQLLVLQNDEQAFGVTYRWNDEGTDAVLLEDELRETIALPSRDGEVVQTQWHYNSRSSCLTCHNKTAGFVLGVSTRQLNRQVRYPRVGHRNQLVEWSRGSMFVEKIEQDQVDKLERLAPMDREEVDLTTRVRSYLDANCAHCHLPGGVRASFDARWSTPLEQQNLIGGAVLNPSELVKARVVTPGNPSRSALVHRLLHDDNRMPPLDVHQRDTEAIEAIYRWIDTLPRVELPPLPPGLQGAATGFDREAAPKSPEGADSAEAAASLETKESPGATESATTPGPEQAPQ
ncbi:MAG: hypothetical protein DWQ31_11520 [Planctomycetota bacterium]|nr:MAG: hypothetical protein DWQ31_11520 [Planctomycetota bacterium]REJ89312.1 MAG: hypothetical protein DWQ35_18420 [Planctomycetota bacterium]